MQAATLDPAVANNAVLVSIPAAYAGCDSLDLYSSALSKVFQSPQPMQAATLIASKVVERNTISIPAAYAGCDSKDPCRACFLFNFNPRSLCRLRLESSCRAHTPLYFNPRSLCRLRRHDGAPGGDRRISIPAAYAGCDAGGEKKAMYYNISIPAAYAGCDNLFS